MTLWFLLAAASAIIFGLATFCFKVNAFKGWPLLPFFAGVYASGTVGFAVTAYVENVLYLSAVILLSGMIVGIGSTFGNLLFMRALEYGPASLTSPLVNTNILLIVLMSVIVYAERPGAMEYTGIFLIVAAVSLLPLDPREKLSIPNRIWYVFVFAATALFFLRNGGLKVTEELALPNTTILFVGYAVGLLWSLQALLRSPQRNSPCRLKSFQFGLGAGLFSFAGMQLYAWALQSGPASIVSPVFSTNSLVVALLSVLYLRERLTRLQTVSLALVFIGILLLQIS
ncbi:EamA family transporter [Alkalicoccus luteus]|uniref:EamA family transporter n=1 Tax=Alkalicoccus luteus TaxID=1237094 RepID=UPI004034186C